MRSVVSVGLFGAVVGAVGLFSLTWLSRDTPRNDVDAAVRALLERGEALWHASCPVDEVDGACVELAADPPTRCGPGGRAWIAVPRDPRQKAAALAAFAGVIDTAAGRAELRHELAIAKLHEADELREAALASSELPLDAWLQARVVARDRAAAGYADVFTAGDMRASLVATARSAQVAENFADALFTHAIPASLATGADAAEWTDAYCDALTAAAEPVLARAIAEYATCFADASGIDPVASLCERALERLDPAGYPLLSELHGRVDAGVSALQARNFAAAKQYFAAALVRMPTSYDAIIGLGIAQRGLGDFAGAEASYARARDLEPSRGDAYFDLAILYKDFRSTKADDLLESRDMYEHARALFDQFLGKKVSAADREQALIEVRDCDKLIAQVDAFISSR